MGIQEYFLSCTWIVDYNPPTNTMSGIEQIYLNALCAETWSSTPIPEPTVPISVSVLIEGRSVCCVNDYALKENRL